jgi:hypothetical protein
MDKTAKGGTPAEIEPDPRAGIERAWATGATKLDPHAAVTMGCA